MIAEYNDILVHPKKGKKEKKLPENAILVPNPAEAALVMEMFRQHETKERFLYNSKLLVDTKQRLCVAGPCLGAPAAALIMEKLIVLGVKSVSLFSCCGAIDPDLSIGDVVIAVSGVPGEGVSTYYGGDSQVSPYGDETERLRKYLAENKEHWLECGLWSTDAPYRESRSALKRLRELRGISAVDMEFTALCSVASFREIDFGGLFVVSDELWGQEWKPGFTKADYRNRTRSILSGLIAHKFDNVRSHEKNI